MVSGNAGSLFKCIAIGAFAMLAAFDDPAAQEDRLLATMDKPATVPIVQSLSADATKGGPMHVIVTVTGFQPSPAGPVQAIVEAKCGTSLVEIGRFGILPQTSFSASEPSKAQRFSFAIASDSTCQRPESVIIRLVPSHGDGRGATLEIGRAELR
jgi:hypothetical protein